MVRCRRWFKTIGSSPGAGCAWHSPGACSANHTVKQNLRSGTGIPRKGKGLMPGRYTTPLHQAYWQVRQLLLEDRFCSALPPQEARLTTAEFRIKAT